MSKGVSKGHSSTWNFNNNFYLSFDSLCLQYNKTGASLSVGVTEIKTYIHSLPWEMMYFHLTERENNTITNTFHTANMEHVKVQIYNIGISNPVLQSQITVDFKVLNTNNYLGEWRRFENHGPCHKA